MPPSEFHGLLVLDKPGGVTSRDAVNRIQRQLPRRTKIGHTGTLDPLATGVLVVCLGHATRLAEYVQAMRKTYRSTFLLGATSDTDDADGTVRPAADATPVPQDAVEAALANFVGERDQVPPAYSAAKVSGQRAYDLAREGTEVDLKPRRVQVYAIEVLAYSWPRLELEVRCGRGTYIRSIARDLGAQLGCGGLVSALRRTAVGPFTTEQAVPLDSTGATIRQRLRPMSQAVAELPRVIVTEDEARRLRHGQAIPVPSGGECAAFDGAGGLVALCRPDDAHQSIHPTKVIPA